MILHILILFFLVFGFFRFRYFTILLLLNLEGLILFSNFIIILFKASFFSMGLLSMFFLSLVVLEASLGLCIITLMMRFFEQQEVFFLQSLKI